MSAEHEQTAPEIQWPAELTPHERRVLKLVAGGQTYLFGDQFYRARDLAERGLLARSSATHRLSITDAGREAIA